MIQDDARWYQVVPGSAHARSFQDSPIRQIASPDGCGGPGGSGGPSGSGGSCGPVGSGAPGVLWSVEM